MRWNKRIIAAAIFSALCGAAAAAAQFSLQISECGGAESGVSDAALQFEDVMLEYFFDAGCIVSNSPAQAAETPGGVSLWRALSDARDGSLDYLASVVLTADGARGFSGASWELYSVEDGEARASGALDFGAFYGTNAAAGRNGARTALETALKECAVSLSRDVERALRRL